MATTNIPPISKADIYMNLLEPLDLDLKLDILGRLSASIKNMVSTNRVKESNSTDFFAGLGDGWKDGLTTDEVMSQLYADRTSNKTRPNINL